MKKTEKMFKWWVYPYAPESFKLFFNGQEVKMSDHHRQELGNIAITKENELVAAIKKYVREKTNLSAKANCSRIFAFPTKDGKEYIHANARVKRFCINSKLEAFKELKRILVATNYQSPIEVETAKLDANMKVSHVEKHGSKLELANRVALI